MLLEERKVSNSVFSKDVASKNLNNINNTKITNKLSIERFFNNIDLGKSTTTNDIKSLMEIFYAGDNVAFDPNDEDTVNLCALKD